MDIQDVRKARWAIWLGMVIASVAFALFKENVFAGIFIFYVFDFILGIIDLLRPTFAAKE